MVRDVKKEVYKKPEIKSETVEMAVYGQTYGKEPIPQLRPFFGLCNCNGAGADNTPSK